MGFRIDIGSGYKNEDNLIRLDRDPRVNPDYIIDLEKDKLPFEDNSVEYVKAYHILEHMGDGFFHLMQELYRVCEKDAILEIEVPYFRHQAYFNDPTHKRAITGYVLGLFGKEFCDWTIQTFNSSSGMAYDYDVDFKIIEEHYNIDKSYAKKIEKRKRNVIDEQDMVEFNRWIFDTNGLIYSLYFKLKVIKE